MSAMLAASPSELLMSIASKAAGRKRSVARRRLTLIVGLVMLAIAILAIALAPVLVSQSPTAIDVLHPLAPPGTPGHLLGTDQYGRDLLARILYGGRVDLAIAFRMCATNPARVAGAAHRKGALRHALPPPRIRKGAGKSSFQRGFGSEIRLTDVTQRGRERQPAALGNFCRAGY